MINTLVEGIAATALIEVLRLLLLLLLEVVVVLVVLMLIASSSIADGITASWVFEELLGFELSPLLTSSLSVASLCTVVGRLEDTEKPSCAS